MDDSIFTSTDGSPSPEHQVNAALQSTLKRVSREIHLRKTGWKDCKQPLPPMYERVGNSVAYQLLLQFHPKVSVKIINMLYPALKELEACTNWLFEDYIEAFNTALKKKATPSCLHPADAPTVRFLADLCVHVCSLPPDAHPHKPLTRTPELWMQVLAIFSKSPQNQKILVEHRCPSKVVGCMNLTSMSGNSLLQCSGWEVLTNVVSCSTCEGKKPAVHLQAVTLLLGHIRCQLDKYSYNQELISSILRFLSTLVTMARSCALASPKVPLSPDSAASDDTQPRPYSHGYALDLLQVLNEGGVKQLMLELPEHLLVEDLDVKADLRNILQAMAPISQDLMVETKTLPPPKPRRARCRTQININTAALQFSPPLQRALPETVSMSSFRSADDLLELVPNLPPPSPNPELSLPANLALTRTTSPPVQSTLHKTASATTVTKPPSPSRIPQRPKARHSIAVLPSTQQLPHYNRLSAKRNSKARLSYIKAVTSPKQKQTSKGETKVTKKKSAENDKVEHEKVVHALTERKELLVDVAKLWRMDKGLQAASNSVCACFFTGSADIPLFVDCIDCFSSTPSHWTLGVCIVLLPYLRQIIHSHRGARGLEVVNKVIALIVKRFSSSVLTTKKGILSSKADAEQRLACYHELHLVYTTTNAGLAADLSPDNRENFERILLSLKPYSNPL